MTDRIVLANMRFLARHGVNERERIEPQEFQVDLEMTMNLQPAGIEDDLAYTVDYSAVYEIARQVVESTSYCLIEALAEAIAHEVLAAVSNAVTEVTVRVRKPQVQLGGPLDYAGVEIRRQRAN